MRCGLWVSLLACAVGTGPLHAQQWQMPRTSWGEPDLQGTWSNDNEYATPLERPAEFAGKTINDITPEDLAAVRKQATEKMIAALAPGPRGPDVWWLENLDLTKRSQPWLVIDPPDGKIPPLTAEARARGAGPQRSSFAGGPFNSPKDFGPLDRCISRGLPGSMIPVMYGNVYGIFQSPGFVTITYEIIHEARVIPIDAGPHVGAGIALHMGDARGRWEGDTLVVESTNFNPLTVYRGATPERLKLTERFKRVSADKVAWSVTMDDPTTWTAPWTIAMALTAEPQQSLPFECHEGNNGLRNILSAARANERKAAQ
ncbi:MAG TPA: hypothetical protein VF405_01620 [Gammaproteobacteria bacterium]